MTTYRPGTTRYVEKDQRGVIEPSVSLSNESSVAFASLTTGYSATQGPGAAPGVLSPVFFGGDVVENGPSFATFDGTVLTFTKSGTYAINVYQTDTGLIGTWGEGDFVQLRVRSAGNDVSTFAIHSNSIMWTDSFTFIGTLTTGPKQIEADETFEIEYISQSTSGVTFSQGARLEVIRLGD